MNRQVLEKFIGKYNLGGVCESVTYNCSDKKTVVRAISTDKNVLCEVVLKNNLLPEGKYSIYETSRLRSMIGVLDDSCSIEPLLNNDTPYAIKFIDGKKTVITFVLSDESIIPTVPDLKKLPDFELQISLTEEFVNTFIKAKGALIESDTFTISSKDGNTEVVLGFSNVNTNRIKLQVPSNDVGLFNSISFSAEYLKNILSVNKESTNGILEVSSKGLARLKFKSDDVDSVYYLVQIVVDV